MIETWIADVTPLYEKKIYEMYRDTVPDFRREKADRLRRQEDRALSIGAWIIYMEMKKTYHLDETALYNLSHSGHYALCSVDTSGDPNLQLGCDVEMVGKYRPAIAKRFFCESEYCYLEGQDPEKQREDFYRFWVLKESFVKATREGIGREFHSFEIELRDPIGATLVKNPEEFEQKYYYQEYIVPEGDAKVAVCSTSSGFGTMKIHHI